MNRVKLKDCPSGTFYHCGVLFTKRLDGGHRKVFADPEPYTELTPDTEVTVGVPFGSTSLGTPDELKKARQKALKQIQYGKNALARAEYQIAQGAKDLLGEGATEKTTAAKYGLTVRELRKLLKIKR